MTVNVNQQVFDDDAFPDELRPGTELLHGQYVIEKFLNSGGFGITYLAKDSLDRTVVIKECFPGSFCRRSDTIVCVRSRAHQNEFGSIVKLFVQEAKNLAKLKHPNIVGVHQIFEDNETAYMALDYVEGRDLLDILEDPNDGLTPSEIQSMTKKLLSAIEYIHKSGVLHRDVSPDNILVDRKTGEPVLIDFGAAREEATRQTRLLSAMRVVKDGYSPQEFYIQGSQQTPSSDLYAFGATLYHAITSECPPDSQSRLAAVAAQKPDPYRAFPPDLPGYEPRFLKAINQAMNIFPYDRIQSAAEWLKFITPEPEIVALPSSKIRPRRPVSVIANDGDLADHAAAGNQRSAVEPPVPAMLPTMAMENQPPAPGEERLNAMRHQSEKSSNNNTMIGLLGGVAAVVVLGVAGALYYLPSGFGLFDQAGLAPVVAPVDETQAPAETESVEATDVVSTPVENPVAAAEIEAPTTLSNEATPAADSTAVASAPVDLSEIEVLPSVSSPLSINNAGLTETATPTTPTLAEQADPENSILTTLEAPSLDTVAEPPTLAAQVEQTVMAAIAPPKTPQTEPPVLLSPSFEFLDETPQILGMIKPFETSFDLTFSTLEGEVASESMPQVDVATAEPLPEPEPEPVVAEVVPETPANDSSIVSDWAIDVPFEQDAALPATIATVREGAPEWLKPGLTVIAVNDVQISSIDEIPSVVAQGTNIDGSAPIFAEISYMDPEKSGVQKQTLPLQAARNVYLQNGFQFKTVFAGGEWQTLVSVSPESGENALRTGDRLVAYIATNERLDRENALADIFERELSNGTAQFAFAVNRSGELWIASLGYTPEKSN